MGTYYEVQSAPFFEVETEAIDGTPFIRLADGRVVSLQGIMSAVEFDRAVATGQIDETDKWCDIEDTLNRLLAGTKAQAVVLDDGVNFGVFITLEGEWVSGGDVKYASSHLDLTLDRAAFESLLEAGEKAKSLGLPIMDAFPRIRSVHKMS